MSDINYKKWPSAINQEPVTVIPTSPEPALQHGNLVLCVNFGRPKREDIPSHLQEYFAKLGSSPEQKERGIPVLIYDEKPYLEALKMARLHWAIEKNYTNRIHAITVVPANSLNDFSLLKNDLHFLRNNGIHGIALFDKHEKPNNILRVGIINKNNISA